jgi:hypothetical protein
MGVSGHVNRPGVYELELGIPLRKIVEELCGGMRNGKKYKAAIPGGVSMGILGPDQFDAELDFDIGRKYNVLGLGTACPTVFDEDTDMVAVARNISRFFKHESCGQCTPCREGSGWLYQLLSRIEEGNAKNQGPRPGAGDRHEHGQHARHDDLRPGRRQQLGGAHDHEQVPERVRIARQADVHPGENDDRRRRTLTRRRQSLSPARGVRITHPNQFNANEPSARAEGFLRAPASTSWRKPGTLRSRGGLVGGHACRAVLAEVAKGSQERVTRAGSPSAAGAR